MPKNLSVAEVESFRTRLCGAAERLFAEHGPDGVSMRQLADELGCSAMTPYRYFRDKQDILAAVRAAVFNRFADAMEKAARTTGDAAAKSRAAGEAYVRFALRDPQAYRLMFDVSQPHPNHFPDLVRATARARRAMRAHVEAMIAEGVLVGDPELIGYAFWAANHGLIMLHLANKLPVKPDFQTIRRATMQLLIQGARDAADTPAARNRAKPERQKEKS
jgi:AcrR family transcriptional regulator